MGNNFKYINIKNCTYYFFDDMIDIKNLNTIKTKIGKNLYKSVLICQLHM